MNTGIATARLDELLHHLLHTSGLSLSYTIEVSATQARPVVAVEFTGDDVVMLTARNGELLLAIEHVAAKALRLEPDEHDLIRFEAAGFKANRDWLLRRAAELAIEQVQRTGQPFHFSPMSSHERRLLHLALAETGLRSESEGDGPLRHLVLHPSAQA